MSLFNCAVFKTEFSLGFSNAYVIFWTHVVVIELCCRSWTKVSLLNYKKEKVWDCYGAALKSHQKFVVVLLTVSILRKIWTHELLNIIHFPILLRKLYKVYFSLFELFPLSKLHWITLAILHYTDKQLLNFTKVCISDAMWSIPSPARQSCL